MGQAIVKADLSQVCEIVYKWIAANGFTLVSDWVCSFNCVNG